MKRWKVEQQYTVIVRAFCKAETLEKAKEKFEEQVNLDIRWDDPEDETYQESDWDTLTECDAYGNKIDDHKTPEHD